MSVTILLNNWLGLDEKRTIVDEIHQAGRGAHGDACPGVLKELGLLFDLEVLCKLRKGVKRVDSAGCIFVELTSFETWLSLFWNLRSALIDRQH